MTPGQPPIILGPVGICQERVASLAEQITLIVVGKMLLVVLSQSRVRKAGLRRVKN